MYISCHYFSPIFEFLLAMMPYIAGSFHDDSNLLPIVFVRSES